MIVILFQKSVDDLYDYRDHYFERHSLDEAISKPQHVEEQLNKTLQVLDSLQGEPHPCDTLHSLIKNIISGQREGGCPAKKDL